MIQNQLGVLVTVRTRSFFLMDGGGTGPNTSSISLWLPLLGTRKSAPKQLKTKNIFKGVTGLKVTCKYTKTTENYNILIHRTK